jgi:epoxyqueuosine reductase QueG
MATTTETVVDEIRRLAEAEQVPLLGFCSASKMADESPGYEPEDLLPGAKGLVSFAVPVPRGIYRTPGNAPEMICRAQSLSYRRLDGLSVRIAALLEEKGERAIPVFGCSPMQINERGDVAGYLNHIRMGELAGIGVRGRNGVLVNSRYGARLMLGGVVTTASLPEIRFPEIDEPGCPPGCQICADACPVRAIDPDGRRVKIMRCLNHTSRTALMSKPRFVVLRAIRPRAAARLLNLTSLDEHTLHVCSKCVALCPYGD